MPNPKLLAEGLKNFEDLDITAFIDAVRRIGQMQAAEILDGSKLYFGLDDSGKFYTSRSMKRTGERYYTELDYPLFASNNGLRAAHLALQYREKDIKIAFSPGDLAEVEIIYGRQPKAVSYGLHGSNFISLTRGIDPTPDSKVQSLASELEHKEVVVKSIVVDTPDGVNLERESVIQTFSFVGQQKISGDALKVVKLEKELKKLESYLEDKSGINELSNFELMRTSIGSIPKEQREEAKAAREKVIATVKNKHKLTIKKALLDKFVRKLKPSLGASDLSDAENLGVHAVLLSDPETGEKIRVADKATFDVVNDFNFAIRNQISGLVRSTDDVASLESRGGIVGQMKIRIADLLGNRELAISRNAKKIFADNLGDHAPMTLRNVAKMLNGGRDVEGLKRKIEAVVDATLDELQNMLKEFNKHKDSPDIAYRLKLRNGKTIGLSAETIKRTQVTFAEARRNLQELKDKIHAAKTFENVIAVLYGRMAKQAHASEPDAVIDESLNEEFQSEVLIEKRNFTDFDRYREITDAQSLIQIYVATVLMATVIYKAEDKHGQKFLRDKTNYRMMKYNNSMSALNFWGFAVWRSKNPVVSKVLQPKVAAGLHRIVSKVPPQWVRDLHLDLSFAGNVQIDWDDHLRMMKYLLQHSGGTAGIDRITSLVDDAFNYEKLSFDQKTKFLPKLYFFATQFVPSSPLITRVRYIQNTLLGSGFDPLDDVDSTVVFSPGAEVNKLLGEDGEIATGADAEYSQTTATDARATVAAHIASRDSGMSAMKNQGLGMKRTIVKRKRNPDIKFKKFERPKEEQKS